MCYMLHYGIQENFIDSARLFIFETYCRIHQVEPKPQTLNPKP